MTVLGPVRPVRPEGLLVRRTPLARLDARIRLFLTLYGVPLAVFALSRVLDAFLIAEAATHQTTFVGAGASQPYPHIAGAGYGDLVGNWDGQWYRQAAEHGYPSPLPQHEDGEPYQNTWIFLPLYPALVRLVMVVTTLPFVAAASIVSILCGAAAMCVIFRMVLGTSSTFTATASVVALCFFPSAPVFQVAYAESLALLLVAVSVVLLGRRRYGWFAVATVLLGLTRAVTLPLGLVVLAHAVVRWRRRETDPLGGRERWGLVVAAASTGVGFLLWPAVAAVRTGRADAYFASRDVWFSVKPLEASWMGELVSSRQAMGVVALVAFTILLVLLLQPRARAWPTDLRVWAASYGLYLLIASGPGGSILRYALLTVVPWWPLPDRPGERVSRGAQATVIVGLVLSGLLLQYGWLRLFFISNEQSVNFP